MQTHKAILESNKNIKPAKGLPVPPKYMKIKLF